jgi:co-chaperonin GroES (HSP10)
MPGLILTKRDYEAVQAQKRAELESSVAHSIQHTALNRLTSDDFASAQSVQRQLDELASYLVIRRETDPGYVLPQPTGWRILVLMLTIEDVTEGGVHLVDEALEAKAVMSPQGVVLGVGHSAYQDPSRFALNRERTITPWAEVGDRVIWKRYDIALFRIANGQQLGFLNDTQPVATLDRGWVVPT